MMNLCSHGGPRSAVISSTYYRNLCNDCFDRLKAGEMPSSGEASYNRQRDLEDTAHYMAQPYVGGLPNSSFIRNYPDKAVKMFSADEMRKYG